MPEASVTLIVAALLFGMALLAAVVGVAVSRRLGAVGRQLRAADERLVNETPLLAARMGAQRAGMAELSAASERALWSLARLDERLDATRFSLAARRGELDSARLRIVTMHATLATARRRAQMLIKMMGLGRAFLG
jgi:hypothetical protein